MIPHAEEHISLAPGTALSSDIYTENVTFCIEIGLTSDEIGARSAGIELSQKH